MQVKKTLSDAYCTVFVTTNIVTNQCPKTLSQQELSAHSALRGNVKKLDWQYCYFTDGRSSVDNVSLPWRFTSIKFHHNKVDQQLISVDLYHGYSQTQKNTAGKSKPKLVSGPIVGVIHLSIAKRHEFETGKVCPFVIQNLIKIESFKMTTLRDTMVDDSENWSTY